MTDQTPITDLAVIREQLTALGNGRETLDQVAQSLNELWAEAETAQDETRLAVISTAWQQAQSLATIANDAVTAAQTAIAMVEQVAAQRDALAEEYEDAVAERDRITEEYEDAAAERDSITEEYESLHQAVKSIDTNHPLVEQLYEMIEQDTWEYVSMVQEESDGIHVMDPGEHICGEHPSIDVEMADDFAYILFGKSEQLSSDLEKELADFVNSFTARANAYIEEQNKIEQQEYEARRAAFLAQQKAQAS